ncbi:response regulator [Azomonas macrocytogenes]|uniref:Diguanylate cyclase (GGDEF)-like protein n=1 Tax=Azomonas macrocytogenes TaxID=69962 RepID=A0A839T537_AZOMA|nr:response regulator [Azomonas macrocytogenes]MBB3104198.1 diguanylate cyclase (GGDEF)-like protein [Azomonas macrocytogenes]
MLDNELSILIVDDTTFSIAMIRRLLAKAGYRDIRHAQSAEDALRQLNERAASLVIADWMMPQTSGLELTEQIRQHDRGTGHYSYIVLLTGHEQEPALARAFEKGVDDFIGKAEISEQLIPRILAAGRLCDTLRNLLDETRRLSKELDHIQRQSTVDALTGLGNLRCLRQRLPDTLKLIEARGGALCYLLIGLPEAEALRCQYDHSIYLDLQRDIANRLQQSIRPLDSLFRLDNGHFAILILLDEADGCTPDSFKRLHENLNTKAFDTAAGVLDLKAAIVMACLDARALPTDPLRIMEQADKLLPTASAAGRIVPMQIGA